MLEKIVMISGKPIRLKATSALPRVYMLKFGRDLFKDFATMQKLRSDGQDLGELGETVMIIENMAYCMACQADPTITADVNEWLDQFELLGVVGAFDQILELWNMNTRTTVEGKKMGEQPQGS